MPVDSALSTYKIDRKAASKMLKVSVRTVDRYIKDRKLSTRNVDGRVWLSREEIEAYRDRRSSISEPSNVDMSRREVSTDVMVDKGEVYEEGSVHTLSTTPKRERETKGIYRKLFQELREELQEKQERLEIANYRVGQLEAQLRNSIPMLEYHRENHEKLQKRQQLEEEIGQIQDRIQHINRKLSYERFNKRLFVTILLVVLALQPLWLLLLDK